MKKRPVAWGVVAVVFLSGAAVCAQSLADVQKKEEDRRKAVKAPAKVFTNDDLKKYPVATPEGTTAGASGDQSASAQAPADDKAAKPADQAAKPAAEEKGEAYWRALIQKAREQLSKNQSYDEALQSRINALTTDFYARDDPAQRAAIWAQRTKALSDAEKLKQEMADQVKAIAQIQEDARRAGVPPGWLR